MKGGDPTIVEGSMAAFPAHATVLVGNVDPVPRGGGGLWVSTLIDCCHRGAAGSVGARGGGGGG